MTQREPDFDVLVVGAGVIGLACARRMSLAGYTVLCADANPGIGWGISSRNSEVIHAGIYYPAGSLKARTCVAGKHWLYDYCAKREIPHRRLQKLIVATNPGEIRVLEEVLSKAASNGVEDLEMLSKAQARALEPALSCEAAVLSPSTGILDSHALMLSFQGDAEANGAQFAFQTRITRIVPLGKGFEVLGADARGEEARFTVSSVINAAGLGAQALARTIEGLPAAIIPPLYLSKGCYFAMSGRAPFSRLIYPVPVSAGLGVHLTLDLSGRAKFGPDAAWVEAESYDVPAERAEAFYDAVRRYFPALPDDALQPDYAGLRPKLQAPGEGAKDFRIDGPATHGIAGLVNLFGIESPGLTASPALADVVFDLLHA